MAYPYIGSYVQKFFGGTALNQRYGYDDAFIIKMYWGTGSWTQIYGGPPVATYHPAGEYNFGSFGYPQGTYRVGTNYEYNPFGSVATFYIDIVQPRTNQNYSIYETIGDATNLVKTRTFDIKKGEKLLFEFLDQVNVDIPLTVFLPDIGIGSNTTRLYVGSRGETYYDSGYTSLACGYQGTYEIIDVATLADSRYKYGSYVKNDYVNSYHNMRYNPYRISDELSIGESFNQLAYRMQAATSWIFSPQYRVLIDLNDTGDYATTNWHERINKHSSINKAQKHWSGKYETTEWSPEFVDENNELLGSMYSSGYDVRGKQIVLRALITDMPYTWNTQFSGKIRTTRWQDGLLTVTANDELRNLVNRKFVFDYECVGTVISGKQYGIVKAINGTSVMIDDMGNISKIERKSKIRPNYLNVLFQLGLGIKNGVSGNWVGVGINAGAMVGELSKSGEKLDAAFTQVFDDNLIPDDTVFGANTIKFYPNSISGLANNSSNPLNNRTEYKVNGGTFVYGLYGTLNVEDSSGINIGDYLYVQRPLIFSGNPNRIIRQILTGTNIDYPYNDSNFSDTFNSELDVLNNVALYKQIDFDSDPFKEIKELAESCQLYFYVDGSDKFSISSIDGKDILQNNSNIATYSDVTGNILKGFGYQQSTEDAYGKLIYKYAFSKDQYNRKKEFTNQGQFNSYVKTVETKWVHNDDDAYVLGNRIHKKFGTGYETISIPTTLYGLLNNVGDLIRVTHRTGSITNKTFEIVSQAKDLDSHSITFEAENVEYINSAGYGEWGTPFNPISGTSKSGYSLIGIKTGVLGTYTSGASNALDSRQTQYNGGLGLGALYGHYFAVGSTPYNIEICAMTYGWLFSGIIVRGLFNTVSKPIGTADYLYDLGPINFKFEYANVDTNFPPREAFSSERLNGITFATTIGINSLIGTSFNFF